MSGWTVVDGHAVRTATLILSGMVGALVLVVFICLLYTSPSPRDTR